MSFNYVLFYRVSFYRVSSFAIQLGVILLSAILLSVIQLSVILLSVFLLSVILLSGILVKCKQNITELIAILVHTVLLSDVLKSIFILSGIQLNGILPNVNLCHSDCYFANWHSALCCGTPSQILAFIPNITRILNGQCDKRTSLIRRGKNLQRKSFAVNDFFFSDFQFRPCH